MNRCNPVFVVIERHTQVRAGIQCVDDVQLIAVFPRAIILNNGKVQVNTGRIAGIAGIVALVAQQGTGFHQHFAAARGKITGDEALSGFIRHVGVIQPDLPVGI